MLAKSSTQVWSVTSPAVPQYMKSPGFNHLGSFHCFEHPFRYQPSILSLHEKSSEAFTPFRLKTNLFQIKIVPRIQKCSFWMRVCTLKFFPSSQILLRLLPHAHRTQYLSLLPCWQMMVLQKASLCLGLFIASALTEACHREGREPQTTINQSMAEPTANIGPGDADLKLIIVAVITINVLNRRVNRHALIQRRHSSCSDTNWKISTTVKLQRIKPTFF